MNRPSTGPPLLRKYNIRREHVSGRKRDQSHQHGVRPGQGIPRGCDGRRDAQGSRVPGADSSSRRSRASADRPGARSPQPRRWIAKRSAAGRRSTATARTAQRSARPIRSMTRISRESFDISVPPPGPARPPGCHSSVIVYSSGAASDPHSFPPRDSPKVPLTPGKAWARRRCGARAVRPSCFRPPCYTRP
jgi:hypothetical protein